MEKKMENEMETVAIQGFKELKLRHHNGFVWQIKGFPQCSNLI